jgi:hypothetical protein
MFNELAYQVSKYCFGLLCVLVVPESEDENVEKGNEGCKHMNIQSCNCVFLICCWL